MGEQNHVKFPQEVIDEYATLGVDLPALFSAGHLGTRMGIEVKEASADRVVATMPVEGNTQPYGPSARSAPCSTAAAADSPSAST
jgi:1,4-dihydroxy-2-naphthoyl-CoA hydrolase